MSRRLRPPGPLAWIAAAVTAAHVALLQALLPATPAAAGAPRTFEVRQLPAPSPLAAPAGPAEPTVLAAAAPAPAPRATTAPAPRPPAPVAAPADRPAAPAVAAAAAPHPPHPAPAGAPQRAVVPPPVRLHYALTGQARGLPLSGQADLAWRHDGQRYEARLELSSLLASRIQESRGRLTPSGLAPERYGERTRREEAAHFDPAAGRITFSGNQPEQALAPGAQDRLSVLLHVGALLAGDPALRRPGRVIAVQTASTRDADTWHFSVEAQEELALPGGHQRALRLQRLPRKEFDQKVELWIAPGLDYLPVRVRLTQPSGDWLDQQWAGSDRN
ncbi:DUF3108 domain-containing protein [Ramlibacter sp. MAHUQ-53]|uniref:DUF3108 domain-containing protein n=1 Tax=unclassified Ramlibacter TaxID=2617605 RepID=UPI003629E883